jgi:GntR family transcriptional regulator
MNDLMICGDISLENRATLDQDYITPLHHQVYLILRQYIEDGDYPADQPMPSEPDLSVMFSVSRITIRRALERLKNEGMISRSRGRGTFPLKAPKPEKIQDTGLSGVFENLVAMGLLTEARLVEFSYIVPPEDIRRIMALDRAAKVQRAVRVRSFRRTPFSYLTTFVPEAIGLHFSSADLEEKPLLMLLEEQGRKIDRASQSISARLADPKIAGFLNVGVGSALLCIKRLVRDVSGEPVEYLEALYRPDVYEYAQELSRADTQHDVVWKHMAQPTDEG